MATANQVPLELYLHSEYEPDADFVDGEIEERCVGEDSHSAWQLAIAHWFRMHAAEWRIRVRPEMRIQTSGSRFRVADVAILDAALPRDPIAQHPPLAGFEVLSPEDRHTRLMRKLDDYEAMGVPEIWVIDPETGVTERFEGGQLVRREEFRLPERGIVFAFAEVAALVA